MRSSDGLRWIFCYGDLRDGLAGDRRRYGKRAACVGSFGDPETVEEVGDFLLEGHALPMLLGSDKLFGGSTRSPLPIPRTVLLSQLLTATYEIRAGDYIGSRRPIVREHIRVPGLVLTICHATAA